MASSADVDVQHKEAGSHQALPPPHEIKTPVFPRPQESTRLTFSRDKDGENRPTRWWKHEDAQHDNSFRFKLTDEGNEKLQGIDELPLLVGETKVDQTTKVLHLLEVIKDATHLSLAKFKGQLGREMLRNLAEFLKLPHNAGTLESLEVDAETRTSSEANFHANTMTSSEAIRCIFVALESGRLVGLKSLGIRKFVLTNDDMQSLGRAVGAGCLPSLEEIDLSHNKMLSTRAWKSFAACLPGLPNLQKLSLCYNSGSTSLSRALTDALADVMQSGKLGALKYLLMDGAGMDDNALEAFVKAMSSGALPALELISFFDNIIKYRGVKALAEAIASGNLSGLTGINLGENAIGESAVIALAHSFRPADHSAPPALPRLRFLGLQAVGMAFGATDVRFLGLQAVAFTLGAAGVEALSNTLAAGHLNSLTLLSLRSNHFIEKWASTLVSSLVSNNRLQLEIDLEWSKFPELERLYEQQRERNRKLAQISREVSEWVSARMGKVYLCGEPEVGKTTLRRTTQRSFLQALCMHERGSHVEVHTRGIEVSQVVGKAKWGKKPITLMVWDMAGQDEYHLVHHTFLPNLTFGQGKATIFVVVCDKSNNKKDARRELQYWLKFIASGRTPSIQRPHNRDDGQTMVSSLPHVFLVLNAKGNIDADVRLWWEELIMELMNTFDSIIVIEPMPFIMDVRKRKFVKCLKEKLVTLTKELLSNESIPIVSEFVQSNLNAWSEERKHFPVVHWEEFVSMHRAQVERERTKKKPMEFLRCSLREEEYELAKGDEAKLEAAVEYLSEAGVVIFIDTKFPAEWKVPNRKLVVMQPNWFGKEVAGGIFLPPRMTSEGETPFREHVDETTGSISRSQFQNLFADGKLGKWTGSEFEDFLAILLWLGLCYIGLEENVFLPALTDGSPREIWDEAMGRGQWVMGYSVEHMKSDVCLAPISLWHRFQVVLAQDARISGRKDQSFVTGKHYVSFKVDEMVVFIEVNANEERPTFHSVDIFVKPLWSPSDDSLPTLEERKICQVDLANDLKERLLKLWIQTCPGLGYVERIVWAWPAFERRKVFGDRNLEVKEVKALVVQDWVENQGVGKKMNWKVGPDPILAEQLLSKKDIESVLELMKGKVMMMRPGFKKAKEILEEATELGILSSIGRTEDREDGASTSKAHDTHSSGRAMHVALERPQQAPTGSKEPKEVESDSCEASHGYKRQFEDSELGWTILKKLDFLLSATERIEDGVRNVTRDVRNMGKDLTNVRSDLKEVLQLREDLLQEVQDIETLFLDDKRSTCPRFIYLGENRSSSAWKLLKSALQLKSVHVHFLCEAKADDYTPHVVKDQKGLEVSQLTELGQKILPWLKVSLTVLFLVAKVAANVVVPGSGAAIPSEFPFVEGASTLSESIAMATGYSIEELDQEERNLKWSAEIRGGANVTSKSANELYGRSRKAMADLLGNLSVEDFNVKVGLQRVFLKRSNAHSPRVAWICNDCYKKHRANGVVTDLYK